MNFHLLASECIIFTRCLDCLCRLFAPTWPSAVSSHWIVRLFYASKYYILLFVGVVSLCALCMNVYEDERTRMRMNNVKMVGWIFVGRCDVWMCARLHIEPANKRTCEHPSVVAVHSISPCTFFGNMHAYVRRMSNRYFAVSYDVFLTHHTPCTPAIRCSRCAI